MIYIKLVVLKENYHNPTNLATITKATTIIKNQIHLDSPFLFVFIIFFFYIDLITLKTPVLINSTEIAAKTKPMILDATIAQCAPINL